MEKKVQCILNWTVLVMLVIPLSGCSMGWEAQTKAKITDKELFPTVARIIDEQKGVVWEYLEEDLSRALSSDEYTGFDIVQSTLSEEQGRQYMEFCYAVNDLDAADQAQNVVEFARSLISEEEMASLEQKLAENRSLIDRKSVV